MTRWVALPEQQQQLLAEFTVFSAPIPQPRPRATKAGGFVRMYAAPKKHPIHEFRSKVEHAARKAMNGRTPVDLPVMVWMMFFCTPPKAMSKARMDKQRGIMASGGDIDNMAKGVLDAMTLAHVWTDDSRVSSIYAGKMYTPTRDIPPSVMIKVWLLGEEELERIRKTFEVDDAHVDAIHEDEVRDGYYP